MSKNIVEIYTDGACRGNPGVGGWGAILRYGTTEKEIYGAETMTTNNRMELTAAIEALAGLKKTCTIKLFTDSQYLRHGITTWIENWKKKNWKTSTNKPVKNIDLWQKLEQLTHQHDIEWHWVKGHSGHPENERADQLANYAIDQLLRNK